MEKHHTIDFDIELKDKSQGGCGVILDYYENGTKKWADGSINFKMCPIKGKYDLDELRKKIYYFLTELADQE